MSDSILDKDAPEFSLVAGGPCHRVMRTLGICGDDMQMNYARVALVSLLAWGPLLALSVLDGRADGVVSLPFLHDIDLHVRFLLAVPTLIIGEMVAHRRMRRMLSQFLERKLIPDERMELFNAELASSNRLRDSVWAEGLLLAIIYLGGVAYAWSYYVALRVPTWYATPEGAALHLTNAGWWYACLSLPLFQFLYYRWYFRIFLWGRFLWRVSRIELRLIPAHPDRSGGLGFLATMLYAFVPFLLAQSGILSGLLGNLILFKGAHLPDFKLEIVALLAVSIGLIVGPLYVFSARMENARREGGRIYGALAARYVREFEEKWVRGGAPVDEGLIGSADIQSLADMGNSFAVVKEMRVAPFGKAIVLELAVLALIPLTPLLLTMVSIGELVDHLINMLF